MKKTHKMAVSLVPPLSQRLFRDSKYYLFPTFKWLFFFFFGHLFLCRVMCGLWESLLLKWPKGLLVSNNIWCWLKVMETCCTNLPLVPVSLYWSHRCHTTCQAVNDGLPQLWNAIVRMARYVCKKSFYFSLLRYLILGWLSVDSV